MNRYRATTCALVLLAYGLRVYLIGGQSLWGDEAISIGRAMESLLDITRDAPHEGTLPPLYYYLLHFWLPWVGTTEFAVRFLSLVWGVLTVPALYVAVRRTAGDRAGVMVALLAAVSPFYVYYSQETRMYAQATCLATFSTALFLRLVLQSPRNRVALVWLGYVATSTLAVFTHYFAGFVLVAQNVVLAAYLGAQWITGRIRTMGAQRNDPAGATSDTLGSQLLRWCASQVAILLLLTPWVLYAGESLRVTAAAVNRAGMPLGDILQRVLLTFSLGSSIEAQNGLHLSFLFLALALLALACRPREAWTWLVLLVIPVLCIYYVSFIPQVGWTRYFMVASPAWLALVAVGLDALLGSAPLPMARRGHSLLVWRRGVTLAVLAALLLSAGVSLAAYYWDPRYARYDWRGAVARLEANPQSSTAVIVNGPAWLPDFDYYFRGSIARYDLPRGDLQGWDRLEPELRRIAATHTGVWLVKYYPPDYDPDGRLERWLAEHAFRTGGQWVENATFSYYSLPRGTEAPATIVNANFGDQIVLRNAVVARVQEPGGYLLQLTLTWQATAVPDADYAVFVHLVDQDGRPVAQYDSVPVSGFRPTSAWQPGELVTDRMGLAMPVGSQAASLQLWVGLYRPNDGRRIPVLSSQHGDQGDHIQLSLP